MDSWRGPSVPELPGRGPEPRLRDSASGELRAAAAGPAGGAAGLYACGITPYDATHIGHAATYVAWDLLVRAWLDAGRSVSYVQNVTDVDDPLLERAERDGEDWRGLAGREIGVYRADMTALRVLPPDHLIGAVEALPLIERFNARLADRGALYDLDGDTYFARSADAAFGSLSGPGTVTGLGSAEMAALFAENGGDPERPGKKDPLDCIVWRAERPGEPAWDSAFGRGRPGWHVECAAIAVHYLGEAFDVQAGGSDLIFPHHEMSASHTRVALGGRSDAVGAAGAAAVAGPAAGAGSGAAAGTLLRPPGDVFARVYAHAGMVGLDGQKMSKSLGNLVFVSRLVAGGEDPMAVRLALLAHHYRADWDWTDAGLEEARQRLARWRSAVAAASQAAPSAYPDAPSGAADSPAPDGYPDAPSGARAVLDGVRERLADDLDAPGALMVVDRWADNVLAVDPPGASPPGDNRGARPSGAAGARLVRDAVDALLGVAL